MLFQRGAGRREQAPAGLEQRGRSAARQPHNVIRAAGTGNYTDQLSHYLKSGEILGAVGGPHRGRGEGLHRHDAAVDAAVAAGIEVLSHVRGDVRWAAPSARLRV